MILIKATILLGIQVLVVLANPANPFYPITSEKEQPCGVCSRYLKPDDFNKPVPVYPKQSPGDLQNNNNVECGKANPNGLPDLKKNNVTETKNTKVVGGGNAKKNEFPWQVGLAFGYGSEITCGGSIISSWEILTAAHCVQDGRYEYTDGNVFPYTKCIYAVVGEYNKTVTRKGEQWNRICDVKKHREYKGEVKIKTWYGGWRNETYLDYDIAVLTLCTELKFTAKVAPVCLPQKTDNEYDQYTNTEVTLSGWGRTRFDKRPASILQKVDLETLPNTVCFDGKFWPKKDNHKSKICAYDGNGEKGSCNGDSGGPLVYKKSVSGEQRYILIGVVSYGPAYVCVKKDYPSVFGRVTAVMDDWLIEEITGERGKQPVSPPAPGPACSTNSNSIELRKDSKNSRSLKNTGGVTYYHFEKDKKLSRKKAQETCISKYGGQLTSINTQDEYEWIKEQVKDLKMFGQIAIGGQWKDKSSRKFEWTDESEMDMSVLNANWFRTRNYQFPSYKNKKRINLELWYSRRALGFANALDHKAPTMYICKVADSCSA